MLCGEAGCGKTTLMAKVATCLSEWLEDEAGTLILRFVGTTGESGSTSDLLTSLCVQMARISADDLCGEASKGKIEETHRGIPQVGCPLVRSERYTNQLYLPQLLSFQMSLAYAYTNTSYEILPKYSVSHGPDAQSLFDSVFICSKCCALFHKCLSMSIVDPRTVRVKILIMVAVP